MYSVMNDLITQAGFPHSDTSGSMLVFNSPEIFAEFHVLHRLLLPRHPPFALFFLTIYPQSPFVSIENISQIELFFLYHAFAQ